MSKPEAGIRCPTCGEPMEIDRRTTHHLHEWHCPSCRTTRPPGWTGDAPLAALTADSEAQGPYATTTVPVEDGPPDLWFNEDVSGLRGEGVMSREEVEHMRDHRPVLKVDGNTTVLELQMWVDQWAVERVRLLATVDALTAERDALAKRCEVERWVAVTERLPGELQRVLMWNGERAAAGTYIVPPPGVTSDGFVADERKGFGVTTYWRPIIGPAAESAAGKGSVKS